MDPPNCGTGTSDMDPPNWGTGTSDMDPPNWGTGTSDMDPPNWGTGTSDMDPPNWGTGTSDMDPPNWGTGIWNQWADQTWGRCRAPSPPPKKVSAIRVCHHFGRWVRSRAGCPCLIAGTSVLRRGKWGDRRGSNPQQPESQSGTLPLSYGHHLRVGDCSKRRPVANPHFRRVILSSLTRDPGRPKMAGKHSPFQRPPLPRHQPPQLLRCDISRFRRDRLRADPGKPGLPWGSP